MKSPRYQLNDQQHATVLAALRYYQMHGLADEPAKRPEEIHNIATGCDLIVSLDGKGIDALCERLNGEEATKIHAKISDALGTAIRRAERELHNWLIEETDSAEHRALRKALGAYQEAWDLLK